jgi:hypothetical protein
MMKGKPALQLAVFLSALFVVLGNGRISGDDGEAMFQVTRAMVERGKLSLPPGALPPVEIVLMKSTDSTIPYTVTGRDGLTYSKYGLGQSLVALPLYLLGAAWRSIAGNAIAPRTAVALLNAFLVAGTACMFFKLILQLGYPRPAGQMLALAYALCTPAWVYTHTFFSEPLVTLCLVTAAFFMVRFSQSGQWWWLSLAGGALGMALLTRVDAVAALPAFALYLGLAWRQRRPSLVVAIRQSAAAGALFGVGLGLALLYNYHRFGSPLEFGYATSNWQGNFLVGLSGLTVSPGKGLLWYAPPLILGLMGLPAFARRFFHEALLCLALIAGYVALHAPYTYWDGGWCWGPRLILPILPFVLLPAAPVLVRQRRGPLVRLGIAALLALGLVVQLPALLCEPTHYLQAAYAAFPGEFQARVLYRPEDSPLVGQWRSLVQVTANLRDPRVRSDILELLASAQPSQTTLLQADSRAEARRLERHTLLAYNLPDLWLVTTRWLREVERP